MEEFSQSRGDDDLFDDEIVPIESSSRPVEVVIAEIEKVTLEPTSTETTTDAAATRPSPPAPRARGRGRGRARGTQPRDQHRSGGLSDSKYATQPATSPAPSADIKPTSPMSETLVTEDHDLSQPPHDPESPSAPPASAPTGPANPAPSRPPAVRGDRTATGGVRKPKLTEAELNEKLAAAKERSQNLAAAHARAQADADSFAERERMATQKRAKETQERKVMEGERERNRERKLKALGGREWDAGKDEQDFSGRGGRARRQDDFEKEDDNDLSMYEWKDDRGRGRGRGRGGGRGGRGGGRGRGDGHNGTRGASGQTQPNLNAETDFPALPGAKENPPQPKKPETTRKDSAPATSSWADQVESSEGGKW